MKSRKLMVIECIFQVLLIGLIRTGLADDSTDVSREKMALDCIRHYTGLIDSFSVESIVKSPLSELKIPFLTKVIREQSGYKITTGLGRLNLKSAKRSDLYERRFLINVDGSGSNTLSITSKFLGSPTKDIVADPSMESIERQLLAHNEMYTTAPVSASKITFVDALDIILTDGMSSALSAKEIDGYYVMFSYRGSKPRPVWIIMMRGADPAKPHGDGNDWQRSRMRNIVDAVTGKWVAADSLPTPIE